MLFQVDIFRDSTTTFKLTTHQISWYTFFFDHLEPSVERQSSTQV